MIHSELITRADRLAAGQERKARDVEDENAISSGVRRRYLVTPITAIVSCICLSDKKTKWHTVHKPDFLIPDALRPNENLQDEQVIAGYKNVWNGFKTGWQDICKRAGHDAAAFEEGLLSLSEKTLWAVPSSTVDEPDVSLYDHNRAVAAFSAALLQHHRVSGDLNNPAALRHGDRKKFRFLVGDLSGLQATLFRLRSEGVPSLAKLLRGRSMRFQLLADAALRRVLETFDMPMSAALQMAGGRFLVIVPETSDAENYLEVIRSDFDDWFAEQYTGELLIGLALSEPFAPWDLMPRPDEAKCPDEVQRRSNNVRAQLGVAIENAKLHQLSGLAKVAVLEIDYPFGDCPCCGVRPAGVSEDDPQPCTACFSATKIGQKLPKSKAVILQSEHSDNADDLLGQSYFIQTDERLEKHDTSRGWRWMGNMDEAVAGPAPTRSGLAWAARFQPDDQLRYEGRARDVGISIEENEIMDGHIKTFQALALEAVEELSQNAMSSRQLSGRPMLALLKGDVDCLGEIFAHGLGDRWSLARASQLSRMIDNYFSLRLPHLLESKFPDSYTVFAGGDDFMLVLPWRQGFDLAQVLAQDFRQFAGNNPDLTFSLGIALFEPRTPVSIAATEAGERLEQAKKSGRNRISAIVPDPMSWEEFSSSLNSAQSLNAWIRDGTLSTRVLYRLLSLDDARRRVATKSNYSSTDLAWMGKLGYTLSRLQSAHSTEGISRDLSDVIEKLRELFGIGPDWCPDKIRPDARFALTHALYRNR